MLVLAAVPYCGAGLEPTRLGRCRKCPIGTYNGNEASNEPCYRCPKRTTTTSTGSTHYLDCKGRWWHCVSCCIHGLGWHASCKR